ncbi:MAG: oligosaccharide flippase family protein [Balneolales bacterium]
MGIILRQSFANTLYSFVGASIGFINVIWLFPFVLEVEQFGLTRVMISIALISAQIAGLGMSNVTLRFFPEFRNQENHHFGYLFIAVTVPLAGFLLLSLAGWFLQTPVIQFYSDESALFGDYYFLLLPLLFFILYFNILESYIRSLLDTVVATFFQDIMLRLFHTVVILIYFFGWISFGTFMWLFVVNYGLQTLLMLFYIGIRRQLLLKPDFSLLSRERIRSMSDYALFAILGSVTAIALGNIDMLMVGGLTSLGETAVYAVSYYLASIIKIPSKALIKISQPLIAESQHKNDTATISEIYSKSSINQLLIGGLIFIGIWVNLDHVYRFLAEEYHAGIYVFLFIGLAKMTDMTAGFNAAIIRTSPWYRFDLYATLLLIILTVTTNLIFIPIFGISGAAMATALSVIIHNSVYLFYVRHRYGIQPFSRKTILAILLLLVTLVVSSSLPVLPVWILDFVVRSLLTASIVGGGILLLHLSQDLESSIKDVYLILFKR